MNLAELLVGVETMPAGKRRAASARRWRAHIEAVRAAHPAFRRERGESLRDLVARARANGCALSVADAEIAAIATVKGFTVATRDTAPFLAAGVPVIDPWRL